MTRDLILNPKADIDNIANDWSERLYNTAKAKDKLRTLGRTTGIEALFKGDAGKNLKEYQDIFKKSGNLEEYRNILQGPSFGMSNSGASSIAYPPNNKIDKYISSQRVHPSASLNPSVNVKNASQSARRAAIEIQGFIGPDDSISSIARKFTDVNPYFDQRSFIDQLSEDKDKIGLNDRQRLELTQGAENFVPNWADLLYLPMFRK